MPGSVLECRAAGLQRLDMAGPGSPSGPWSGARPDGTGLAGGVVADGEDEVELRSEAPSAPAASGPNSSRIAPRPLGEDAMAGQGLQSHGLTWPAGRLPADQARTRQPPGG